MTANGILAVGGAHIDRRGQVAGAFVPGASNPGTMREEVGGGVFNAARNAARRGASLSLISLRGGDAAGEMVARAIADAGIADLSAVFLDRATPSYTALIDRDGDVIAALADMGLYDLAFAKQLRRSKVRDAVDAADAVLCDANLPAAALARLVDMAGDRPVFAIAISPAKAVRLAGSLPGLGCLFMNLREAAALAGADSGAEMSALVGQLRDAGLRSGVISHGSAPTVGFDGDGLFSIPPPVPRNVADVTGAGDALAGATTVALMKGLPLRQALREGMAAAKLALESMSSVPDFTEKSFAEALALVPEAADLT